MAEKTLEDLEAEMNRERAERNRRLTEKLEREQQRANRTVRKRRIFSKLLILLLVVLAALLALAWMVLQRTNIYIGLGAVAIPGMTS